VEVGVKTVSYQAVLISPIGKLGICANKTHLHRIDFLADDFDACAPTTFAADLTCDQLIKYFNDAGHVFELPCDIQATPFQNRILDQLCQIPLGQTREYGEIAKQARTGPRAVGMVCRTNPIPIIIPCHRVTAKHHIGGYGGFTQGHSVIMKQWLLDHEASFVKKSQ
jgi:methylated-DNA-[protein]-cysteine S-methyltransferase